MATTAVGDENPTLSDVIKRLSPGGVYQPLVEALTVQTPELEDATWKEGNLPNGELITTRSGLPSIGWRAYNEGVTAGKSRTMGAQESPASGEAYTCPPVVPT